MLRPVDESAIPARRVGEARLPTDFGDFRCLAFDVAGVHHLALVAGDLAHGNDVLVRVHSECVTGDLFRSRRCDCGPQLTDAMARIGAEGRGVVVYLRDHEGRGIGIVSKLHAYALQELGRDTVDANLELGLPVDSREFATAAWILADLGVSSVRLLTNNPTKCADLSAGGIRIVAREPLPGRPTPENLGYLRTKRARLGHFLAGLDGPGAS